MNSEIIFFKIPRDVATISAKVSALFAPGGEPAERFVGFLDANSVNRTTLEHAQAMANQSTTRTTKLNDKGGI